MPSPRPAPLAALTVALFVAACGGSGDPAPTPAPSSAAVPAAPLLLQAQAVANTTIRLNWVDTAANESGFKIWRAPAANAPYAWIATIGADKTTHDDAGLPGGTTFFYRVSAFNGAGDSATSDAASAATPVAAAPAAPTALTATMAGPDVALEWIDNANNETGVRIERAIGLDAYAVVATLGPNATRHVDPHPAAPGAQVHYRVRAINAAGLSAGSNVVTIALPGVAAVTLTVRKSGTGGGTVVSSPAGIDCGTTCSMPVAAGATVQLTATPAATSEFAGWIGCSSVDGPRCAVTPGVNSTIFASFRLPQPITVLASVPAESSNGSYTLSWTYRGPGTPSAWTIEEDKDLAFSAPTTEQVTDTAAPFERAYTGKAPGQHCYRVRTSTMPAGIYGLPACVTVLAAQNAGLRINNRTAVRLVSLVLNGQEVLSAPGVAPHASRLYAGDHNQTVTVAARLGQYVTDGVEVLLPPYSWSVDVVTGNTLDVNIDLNLSQLLNNAVRSQWVAASRWTDLSGLGQIEGDFVIRGDDTWYRLSGQTVIESGRLQVVSWPDDGQEINFTLCKVPATGCYGGKSFYPFISFALYMSNQPVAQFFRD